MLLSLLAGDGDLLMVSSGVGDLITLSAGVGDLFPLSGGVGDLFTLSAGVRDLISFLAGTGDLAFSCSLGVTEADLEVGGGGIGIDDSDFSTSAGVTLSLGGLAGLGLLMARVRLPCTEFGVFDFMGWECGDFFLLA